MKKTISVISILLATVIIALATFTGSAAQPKILTVLGDSIASGYGLNDINDSYGSIIADAKVYDQINKAVPGHRSGDLLDLIQNDDEVKDSIKKADIIDISIGGNDFLFLLIKPESPLDRLDIMQNGANAACVQKALKTFTSNINTIASEIRTLNPDCSVIINIQYNPLYASSLFSKYADMVEELAPAMKSIYNSVAENNEGFYTADVHAVFNEYFKNGKYDIIQSDGIHPSVKGHAVIADTLLPIINEIDPGTSPFETTVAPATDIHPTGDPVYMVGDADCSGNITVKDATAIQKFVAGISLASFDELAADADQSGAINVKDATAVQKYLAGLLTDTMIGIIFE